ncbi:hypothetical protein Tco_1324536 [Tanacetum coccineum]|uniref:Uncharacterized protein n=1 Tax=Tanacetum coccineum TaxID=301880 RepID=A0ABQ5DDE3_9ASTR
MKGKKKVSCVCELRPFYRLSEKLLACATYVSDLRAKPTNKCAFTMADVSPLECELVRSLDMTDFSLPSCLGALELPILAIN